MKKILLLSMVLFSGLACGQEEDSVKKFSKDAFTDMRLVFAKKRSFTGGWVSQDERKNLLDDYKKDTNLFIENAQKWLKSCPVDANMHLMLADLMREKSNLSKALYHRYQFYGLLQSIVANKTGESKDQAFEIISADEVHTVLNYYQAQLVEQKLEFPYDILTVTMNGEEKTLFFDVTIPFQAIQNQANQ